MRWTRTFVVGVLLAGYGPPPAPAQKSESAEVLLEAAHKKEVLEGNLEAAIRQYKQILEKHAWNRAVAAKALLQMGRCYEKLDDSEARRLYERVIGEFGDQREAAAAAHSRLAALARAGSGSVQTGAVVRKLGDGSWLDPFGELSPDGKFLSCVDWSAGNLAIRCLETGKLQVLTKKGNLDESAEYAVFSRWSPDGRRIAFDWWKGESYSDLRVIGRDGADLQVLYSPAAGSWVEVFDWSEDGRLILALEGEGYSKRKIIAVEVANGTPHTLKDWPVGLRLSLGMRFSPDARYVIYDRAQGSSTSNRDIFLWPVAGGAELPLLVHPEDDSVLGWSPDGAWVLFASTRSGSTDIWALPVSEGKSAGDARMIKSGVEGISPLGFARSGAFYYGFERQRQRDVFVAEIDPKIARVMARPSKAIRRFEGHNSSPSFSPAGSLLAYVSARGHQALNRYAEYVLGVNSLKTGEHREYRTGFRSLRGMHWSADGASLVFMAMEQDRKQCIARIDLATSEVTRLFPVPQGRRPFTLDPAPDGKGLFLAAASGRETLLSYLDLSAGGEKEIFRGGPGEVDGAALSPDGKLLAFVNLPQGPNLHERVVRVVPAAGGEPREIGQEQELSADPDCLDTRRKVPACAAAERSRADA